MRNLQLERNAKGTTVVVVRKVEGAIEVKERAK
jgi:hypothetical protein